MGPYCKFCGRRCFVPILAEDRPEIREALGDVTMLATCVVGERFDRQRSGFSWTDLRVAREVRERSRKG